MRSSFVLTLLLFAGLCADEREEAIRRGVEILLAGQESFEAKEEPDEWPYEGVYRVRGPSGPEIPLGYRVGGTSICAWALLEAPGWEEDAPRQAAVARGLRFVLDKLEDPGMEATFVGSYDVRGWGHIYALRFLLRTRELERAGELAARVDAAIAGLCEGLARTEIANGGWNYSRGRRAAASPFMTAPGLQALFEARAQGEDVPDEVVDRALQTLLDARLDSGAFQYSTQPGRATGQGIEAVPGAIGRMPVCETTLRLAGRGSVEAVRGALEAFFEHWDALEDRRQKTGTHEPPYMVAPYYFFYAHTYAAQAIEQLPEKERAAFRDQLDARLFQVREGSGAWNDRVFERSQNFGTACVMLALLQPDMPPPAAWEAEED